MSTHKRKDKGSVHREVLPDSKGFKHFWENEGPFAYALTSKEFPPVLLEEEEWLFSNDIVLLLKELLQYDQRKMKVVKAPFNPANTSILRPEQMSSWKINHFPEEWNPFVCDLFVPEGHLTLHLFSRLKQDPETMDSVQVEAGFFKCLEQAMDQLGYVLLSPRENSKYASIHAYLTEWEEDETDAGLL